MPKPFESPNHVSREQPPTHQISPCWFNAFMLFHRVNVAPVSFHGLLYVLLVVYAVLFETTEVASSRTDWSSRGPTR